MHFDISHITKTILGYDTGIPHAVTIGVTLLVCAMVLALFRIKINYSIFVRQASFLLFMGYLFLVLCTTIFFREETFEKRYIFQPFWSYANLYNKRLAEIIMNIIMFIPIGFFAGGALKKKHVWKAIEIGIVLSFFIEITQLITTRGVCNIDDVIHNTLGCAIGFAGFLLCYKMARRIA